MQRPSPKGPIHLNPQKQSNHSLQRTIHLQEEYLNPQKQHHQGKKTLTPRMTMPNQR